MQLPGWQIVLQFSRQLQSSSHHGNFHSYDLEAWITSTLLEPHKDKHPLNHVQVFSYAAVNSN